MNNVLILIKCTSSGLAGVDEVLSLPLLEGPVEVGLAHRPVDHGKFQRSSKHKEEWKKPKRW